MCKWFKRKKPALTLPHLEELPDLTATVDNTSARGLLALWVLRYQPSDPIFWQTIDLQVTGTIKLDNAAETISEWKQVKIRPEYSNEGALAHELSHISYSLLTDQQKADFAKDFEAVKTDPLVALMLKEKPNAKKDIIEAHADLYRYLAHQMPESLKSYYPRLLV